MFHLWEKTSSPVRKRPLLTRRLGPQDRRIAVSAIRRTKSLDKLASGVCQCAEGDRSLTLPYNKPSDPRFFVCPSPINKNMSSIEPKVPTRPDGWYPTAEVEVHSNDVRTREQEVTSKVVYRQKVQREDSNDIAMTELKRPVPAPRDSLRSLQLRMEEKNASFVIEDESPKPRPRRSERARRYFCRDAVRGSSAGCDEDSDGWGGGPAAALPDSGRGSVDSGEAASKGRSSSGGRLSNLSLLPDSGRSSVDSGESTTKTRSSSGGRSSVLPDSGRSSADSGAEGKTRTTRQVSIDEGIGTEVLLEETAQQVDMML